MAVSLSIIIVSYNVRYFLEQCLLSVRRAAKGIATEVIVVDNASDDDTCSFLPSRFPEVQFIASGANLGFAKACNLGCRQASGNYILYLNPDTLLAEDSLHQVLHFIQATPDAGAVGVHMIDGSGRYLPESKRGLPTALTSLFKLCGLARCFPHSRVFGRYYLGHLSPQQSHAVEVLAGAFMLLPRAVHEKVGGFDDAFFMYGEDIDLSYRILQAGYRNYYFAGTTIIHFKGESTRRNTARHVHTFYRAMDVFVRKHYHGLNAVLLRSAIWCRAAALLAAGVVVRKRCARQPSTDLPIAVYAHANSFAIIAGTYQQQGIAVIRLGQLAEARMLAPGQLLVLSTCCLTLQQYMQWIQTQPAGRPYLFYQPGSTALIGSARAQQNGLVWPLQPTANPSSTPFGIVN
ncbi:Glycosyltransferase, GT2 family [Cnuella takakiae]|uniref:Glycosyltransferase, GT2 family n=1 Tax=Cnuella takakiae TaxID=1302690 RepID=A0A1M5F4A8_9BACT|nr:glycosyltransferase family 2 protein [Cnuella takakiae]OLY90970.1 hypothetical protein BUE76_02935 [Cnuella takakiae]SHF86357.1 Glycosyltransferase, GT2 family [Cnuella takakiae]